MKAIPLAVALAVAPAIVERRTYYLFVPDRPAGASPAPVIVTLHGSGRSGSVRLDHWKSLAQDGVPVEIRAIPAR